MAGTMLRLQQGAGNRALTQLVQAKLLVGAADDPFEREADRIASLVVGGQPATGDGAGPAHDEPPPLQRAADGGSADGGFAAPTDFSSFLGRGGGSPLPTSLRQPIESRLGADLSGVAVHTGSDAAAAAGAIGARAFTYGSDVYFGAGQYDPASTSGRHLIAHELTHTLQQTGGVQRKPLDGSLVPARLAQRRIQGSFFGNVKKKFGALKEKYNQFFGRSGQDARTETGDENLDAMSKGELSTYMRRTKGGSPAENPDWSNPKLFGQKPNKFKVKLAVAQDDANWLKNAKALRNAGYKAIFSSEGRAALANMDKEYLARMALQGQGALDGMTDSQIQAEVQKFTDGIYDVGHTWVRLESYVGEELRDLYSFGMWPAKIADLNSDANHGGFAGPMSVGQGEIRHPDNVHEGDAMTAYFGEETSAKKFDQALDLAVTRYQTPPPYMLVGYNCTTFAREIFQAGGGSYPSGGRLLPGFAYTPGNLYKAILDKAAKDKKGKASTEDEHKDIVTKAKSKQELLENAGKRDVEAEIFGKPKPDAKTQNMHLYAGNTIRYGQRPDYPKDNTLALDKDRDMPAVDHPEGIDRFGVYTFWMGPNTYWYVPTKDVRTASKPPKPKKPQATGGVILPLYAGRGLRAPGEGDKAVHQLDRAGFLSAGFRVDQTEGEWVNIATRMGEFYWVKQTWWDYFNAPDRTPIPAELGGGVAPHQDEDDNEGGGPPATGFVLPLYDCSGLPGPTDVPFRSVDAGTYAREGLMRGMEFGEWVTVQAVMTGDSFWARKTWLDHFEEPGKFPVPSDYLAPTTGTGGTAPQQVADEDDEQSEAEPIVVTEGGVPWYGGSDSTAPSGLITTEQIDDYMLDFEAAKSGWLMVYMPMTGDSLWVKETDYATYQQLNGK
jgi:hypothetical protein